MLSRSLSLLCAAISLAAAGCQIQLHDGEFGRCDGPGGCHAGSARVDAPQMARAEPPPPIIAPRSRLHPLPTHPVFEPVAMQPAPIGPADGQIEPQPFPSEGARREPPITRVRRAANTAQRPINRMPTKPTVKRVPATKPVDDPFEDKVRPASFEEAEPALEQDDAPPKPPVEIESTAKPAAKPTEAQKSDTAAPKPVATDATGLKWRPAKARTE